MKRIFMMVAVMLLAGCSNLSYFSVRQFDSTEYGKSVEITQLATRTVHQCSNTDTTLKIKFLNDLNSATMYLEEYTSNKKDEADIATGAKQIREMVLAFDSRETYSVAYCVSKLTNVQNASRTIERAISLHNKYDSCSADLVSLWTPLQTKHESKVISDSEFIELSTDILKLGAINTAACSSQERAQIQQSISIIKQALSFVPL